MSSAPTPDEIWKRRALACAGGRSGAGLARLVEMTAGDYRNASFLDDRMFEHPRLSHLLPWEEVSGAVPADARRRRAVDLPYRPCRLDPGRAPARRARRRAVRARTESLRDLTFFPPDVRGRFVPTLQALFSRTFAPEQTALVKATSFVSEIAAELVPAEGRALHLYATPRSYIAGILAGENSRKELAGMAAIRAERLASRDLRLPPARSEADLAAAAWACEMTALEAG